MALASDFLSILDAVEAADKFDYFQNPVTDDIAKDYSTVVTEPMAISTLRARVLERDGTSAAYTLEGFRSDLSLILSNAILYNGESSYIANQAKKVVQVGCKALDEYLRQQVAVEATLSGPARPRSRRPALPKQRPEAWEDDFTSSSSEEEASARSSKRSSGGRSLQPKMLEQPDVALSDQTQLPLEWLPMKAGDWRREPYVANALELIETYLPVITPDSVRAKLRTSKALQCGPGCACTSRATLGSYAIEKEGWNSDCPCRSSRAECGPACGCTQSPPASPSPDRLCVDGCFNRASSSKRFLRVGRAEGPEVDVVQKNTWGIDAKTRRYIYLAIKPAFTPEGPSSDGFIRVLLCAINRLPDPLATDMAEAARLVRADALAEGNVTYSLAADLLVEAVNKERTAAASQVSVPLSVPPLAARTPATKKKRARADETAPVDSSVAEEPSPEALAASGSAAEAELVQFTSKFRIHPKGQGVVCARREGLSLNEFVADYIGEIYPPWRWFEKQDAVKTVQKRLGCQNVLSDFYNIMLERHTDDPAGYDVLYVDPIRRGNFASRLSHSCVPNCSTVVMAVNGSFAISVYVTRPVLYGEELTFDYSSVTESKDEYLSSVCFCGESKCRGLFLCFANGTTFQEVMAKRHTMLERTSAILRCGEEPLLDEERALLERFGFKGSVLHGLPVWVVKFASLIAAFIDEEARLLPPALMGVKFKGGVQAYSEEAARLETRGVTANRVQNLAVTLNKIKHILESQDNPHLAPLCRLSDAEIVNALWNSEKSLISRLVTLAKRTSATLAAALIPVCEVVLPGTADGRAELKARLLSLRELLRSFPSVKGVSTLALSDLMLMYAHTSVFFTHNSYTALKSPVVQLYPCDIGEAAAGLGSSEKLKAPAKSYGVQFLWGQMTFWERQTIADPTASLMAARFGPVCLPDVECCFSGKDYTSAHRSELLNSIQTLPNRQWSTRLLWRFTNPMRIFGSPWLDKALGLPDSLDSFVHDFSDRKASRAPVADPV